MPVALPALLRATHPEPAVAVTVVTTALAASAGRSFGGLLSTAAAVLAGQLSVGWCNDVVDRQRDVRAGRRDKPLAVGEVSESAARRAAGFALVAAVPLSLLSGGRATLAHLAAVGLAWGYNLGLKSSTLSVLPYAVAFGLLPAFVTLGLPGSPAPPWWAVAAGALLGAGAHFTNVLPDIDDDIATGVHGLPHRLGATASRRLAAVLLLGAGGVLTFGPGRPSWEQVAGLLAASALVLTATFAPFPNRPPFTRVAFRITMLVALLDVLLLLARGRELA